MSRNALKTLALLLLLEAFGFPLLAQQPETGTVADARNVLELARVENRGIMGLEFIYHPPVKSGALGSFEVTAVTKGGPADKAGVEVGDRITRVNGVPFAFPTRPEAYRGWGWLRAGDEVQLSLERRKSTTDAILIAAAQPEEVRSQREGVIRHAEAQLGHELLRQAIARHGSHRLRVSRLQNGRLVVESRGIRIRDLPMLVRFFETAPPLMHGIPIGELDPGESKEYELILRDDSISFEASLVKP